MKPKQSFLLFVFVAAATISHFVRADIVDDIELMLTIAIFLFSIFTGFFIARQGNRFNTVRAQIAIFDASVTSIYRAGAHISTKLQKEAGDIVKRAYALIVKKDQWDYTFSQETTIITDLNALLDREAKTATTPTAVQAVERLFVALEKMQEARKSIISLRLERIPFLQWVLVYILATVLLVSIVLLPASGSILFSSLKGAFITVVVAVIMLLRDFDNLQFFERSIGEQSAKDVLDIIKNR